MSTWSELSRLILNGHNPYSGFNAARFRADTQGWNSHHHFLSTCIEELRPKLVIEVGVWKGGSSIHMAKTLKFKEVDGVVLAVDTFLGSWEHYEQAEFFPSLLLQNGFPSMFYTFLSNVVEAEVAGQVLPLPLDSTNAAHVLSRLGIRAQIIHIDAGHDYLSVSNDLRIWWPILEVGGYLIADDYDKERKVWPSVGQAVDDFHPTVHASSIEALPYKARFKKLAD